MQICMKLWVKVVRDYEFVHVALDEPGNIRTKRAHNVISYLREFYDPYHHIRTKVDYPKLRCVTSSKGYDVISYCRRSMIRTTMTSIVDVRWM
jgi:hypothetical protein